MTRGGARTRRVRSAIATVIGAIAALTLAGCGSVTPYGVADHDAKMSYHSDSVEGLLTDAVFVTLAETENYSSVGYTHAVASTGESLHVQHDTSVMGATWWSRESTDGEGLTIDRIHTANSPTTYYLFGEEYLPVSGTPWVALPEGDVPQGDPASVCIYPSVWYLCGIAMAWQASSETHAAELPVLVERSADGATHLQTAVTLRAIVDAGIFSLGEGLNANLSDETFDTFLPLHVWFDADGLVTKAEINGSFGEDPTLELQLGFEMMGEPADDDRPADPATLDQQFITTMSDSTQIEAFWEAISQIRLGS